MTTPESDPRSPARRARDEAIAAEPQLPPPPLLSDARNSPVEAHLVQRHRRPLAVAGVIENGLVRILDPDIKIPEHARVIVVTVEGD